MKIIEEHCSVKNLRRRLVPIKVSTKNQGNHIRFEQKLPFTTAKVVGVLPVVSIVSIPLIISNPGDGLDSSFPDEQTQFS